MESIFAKQVHGRLRAFFGFQELGLRSSTFRAIRNHCEIAVGEWIIERTRKQSGTNLVVGGTVRPAFPVDAIETHEQRLIVNWATLDVVDHEVFDLALPGLAGGAWSRRYHTGDGKNQRENDQGLD